MNLDAARTAALAAGLAVTWQDDTGDRPRWLRVVGPDSWRETLAIFEGGNCIIAVHCTENESLSAVATAWEARIAPVLAAARGGV